MAKRTVNKSKAVRDYLAVNPKATPSVVKEDLRKDQGIDASYSLISQVKYKKTGGAGGRRGKRGGNGRGTSPNISIEDLVSAKQIADRMGGLDRAKEALKLLAKLG